MSAAGDTDTAVASTVSSTRAQRFGRGVLLLRERGWLLALLGVVVLSVVFVLLGRWQYGRHDAKVLRNLRIDTNYSAPAVPLQQVLPTTGTPFPAALQWRPVSVTGTYESASTVLVRNRPLDGVFGYEVVVPLRLADGSVLLVDRGWIPNGSTGAEPDSVPAAPTGTARVTVRLRPGEPGLDRRPPAGQELRIDLARISDRLATPVYQAYGVLAEEAPRPGAAPTLLPRPDEDLGPHQAYAIQWWGFAAAAYVVLAHYMSREVLAREGAGAGRRPTPRPAPVRVRRRQPTDEEWEDAAGA